MVLVRVVHHGTLRVVDGKLLSLILQRHRVWIRIDTGGEGVLVRIEDSEVLGVLLECVVAMITRISGDVMLIEVVISMDAYGTNEVRLWRSSVAGT